MSTHMKKLNHKLDSLADKAKDGTETVDRQGETESREGGRQGHRCGERRRARRCREARAGKRNGLARS